MIVHLTLHLYREIGLSCGESDIAPLWKINSTEFKPEVGDIYGDERILIYETEDNSSITLEHIQKAAIYILAVNCGIIGYWFGRFKPMFTDFFNNHGAENENEERVGQPRTQKILECPIPECYIGLNRFIIIAQFLLKILIPFLDSISGKSGIFRIFKLSELNFNLNSSG